MDSTSHMIGFVLLCSIVVWGNLVKVVWYVYICCDVNVDDLWHER